MKKIILTAFLLTFFVKSFSQSQIFVGQETVFNGRDFGVGVLIKGSYKRFQTAIKADYGVFSKNAITGVQIGAYLYNSQYVKVGSNIMYDNQLNWPSVNITQNLDENWWYDLNIRPHYNGVFQVEFALVYCFE